MTKKVTIGVLEGGIVAAGTEKERVISGEDVVTINFPLLFPFSIFFSFK